MQTAELVPAAAVEAEEGEVVRACVEGHCVGCWSGWWGSGGRSLWGGGFSDGEK